MQEIYCIIWSQTSWGGVKGHWLVNIPLAEWRALADWCWEDGRREQFRQLVSLGTGDPRSALDAKAVRELQKEVLTLASEPHPQTITTALDALVPFLKEAIRVVDAYAGTSITVTIEFRQDPIKLGTMCYLI